MPETLIDLAFSVATLNNPTVIEKFGKVPGDSHAQDLFARGANLSPDSGDVVKWAEVKVTRRPAPLTGKRSPAVATEGVGIDLKSSVMADVRIATDPIPLDEITSQNAAMNLLSREFRSKRKSISISKEILAWQTLKGAWDSTAIPNSKVVFSQSFAVTALTPLASWATKTTAIASKELDGFATTYQDACGLEIGQYCGDNLVHLYLKQNDEVRNTIQSDPNPDKRGTVLGPSGKDFTFDGVMWHITRAKYDAGSGDTTTLTKYLGDKKLIALPSDAELDQILGHAEGRGSIPTQAIGVGENVGPLGMPAPQAGDYAYAYLLPNPAAVVVVFGWRGLFVPLFPEAIGYATDVTTP